MLSNVQYRQIEWGDCDPAGIVFTPRFFAFFDHGMSLLYVAAGWSKPELRKTFAMAGATIVETSAKFHAPCAFGDEVAITSTIVEVKRVSFSVRHELRKGDQLCVEGLETRVWVAHDKETGRLRSASIPAEVAARFRGEGAPPRD